MSGYEASPEHSQEAPGDGDLALRDLCARSRPAEPTEDAWDRVWSNIRSGLDAPATIPFLMRRKSWVRLSQAAAIVLAATLFLARSRIGNEGVPMVQNPADPSPISAPPSVEITEGKYVLIHFDTDGVRTTELPRNESPYGLDELYEGLNTFEAMGGETVASLETFNSTGQ